MGRCNFISMLAWFLVIQPWTATPNFLAPLLSPISEKVCKKVECGKGSCKPSVNTASLYDCECDPGWKQAGLSFLPCVIPNCSVDYSCAAASPPVQDKETKPKSIFEPCHWMDCAGGTCNKTSSFTYKCKCRPNYDNLLNNSAFPCYRECALGMDCKSLGISFRNKSTSSPPGMADNTNQGSIRLGKIGWLITMTMISLLFLLK